MRPSPEQIAEAHRIAAQAVLEVPEVLPVFLRLERELVAQDAAAAALARAAQAAGGQP